MSAVLVCVTAGRGPAECRAAAIRAARTLAREGEAAGLSVTGEGLERQEAASLLLLIDGEGAGAFVRAWTGPVKVVARSSLRPGHRRKNWFVAVHPVETAAQARPLDEAECSFEALRAGGPGGQHQNRTESAVRVTHRPSGLSVVARDERSQHRNRALALRRLAALLAGIDAREADRRAFGAWLDRISVERGNPVRVLE